MSRKTPCRRRCKRLRHSCCARTHKTQNARTHARTKNKKSAHTHTHKLQVKPTALFPEGTESTETRQKTNALCFARPARAPALAASGASPAKPVRAGEAQQKPVIHCKSPHTPRAAAVGEESVFAFRVGSAVTQPSAPQHRTHLVVVRCRPHSDEHCRLIRLLIAAC